MNLEQFINTYTGQAVDVDGLSADTGQCVQLVALYAQKVLGVTLPDVVGAVDLWNNPAVQANFNQIPVGQEQAGDITVWGASTAINSPEYGHTDIVVAPASGGFTGFDSNWGGDNNAEGYPVAHEVQHTYTDVLGFLRFKGDDMVPTADLLNSLFRNYLGREASAAEQAEFVNKITYNDLIPILEDNNAEHNAYLASIAQGKAAVTELAEMQSPTQLKPGLYKV